MHARFHLESLFRADRAPPRFSDRKDGGRLLESRPNDALLWYIRAERHLLSRDYRAAVADFARGGEPPATMEFAYVYATALLLSGDLSSYREYVVRQADRYGDDGEPATRVL
jgi:hypothetical protein